MSRAPGRTYRYHTGRPHFNFGHGINPLMATSIGSMLLKTKSDCPCDEVQVSISVKNEGTRDGDEVVLAYFEPFDITASQPASKLKKQLFEFERIHIRAGTSETVAFTVTARTLQLANDAGDAMTFQGLYNVMVSNGLDEVSVKTLLRVDQDGKLTPVDKAFYSIK
jgi:beta-glucosidase